MPLLRWKASTWVTIMNINEIGGQPQDFGSDADLSGALSAISAGFPDPAILTRLANEFFQQGTALPVSSTGNGVPFAIGDFSTVLPPALPGVIASTDAIPGGYAPLGVPSARTTGFDESVTETVLSGIPGSLTNPVGVPVSMPGQSIVTSPGAGGLAGFSDFGGLSFLQEARPLFSAVPGLPVNQVPTAPGISDVGSVSSFGGYPSVPNASYDVAAPLVPGSVARSAPIIGSPNLDFLSVARSLNSSNTVPSVEPYAAHTETSALSGLSSGLFDVNAIRRDFPILEERVNGRQLVWLDNAATTHKPQAVIDRISYYYTHENSNIHRAAHTLAARSTDAYEGAREAVRRFLNASSTKEIIFVRGATEGINLIAQSWGRRNIEKDDEIIITWLEHHANIVPWQMLCAEKGAKLRVAPVDNDGQVILEEYEKLFNSHTKLVSVTQVSNALGTVTPVAEMVSIAHRHGALAIVDGAQAVSHIPVDVQLYDCDFYVFSGHKVFAPTGIGVVFGKLNVLEAMPPWQGGGNMIADVTFEKTVYHGPPGRFEAGTGSIAPAVGLGAAIEYLERIGMANIARYEHNLLVYAIDVLSAIPGLHLIGTAADKASVLSFVLDGFKTEEVGHALSQEGIAVRSGHHCAQPILRRFGLESTVRPSLALYNTCEEVDKLVAAIWNIKQGRSPGLV